MKKIIYVLICFSFVHILNAQIVLEKEVFEIIEKGITANSNIQNNEIELRKMELERKSVLSKYIPRIEATGTYAHFSSGVLLDLPTTTLPILGLPLFQDNFQLNTKGNILYGGVMAKAVLFSGGQILNGSRALKEKTQGTSYMMEIQNDEVIKEMIENFDQLQYIDQALLLISESEKRLEKETEKVEKAITEGLAIPYDRDKIKLARLELQSKKKEIIQKKDLLLLKMEQETGVDKEEISLVPHEVSPILIPEDLTTENRNEIKALESFKSASEYVIKKEKGSLLPTLGAFGGYSYASLYNASSSFDSKLLNREMSLNLNELRLNPNWMIGVGLKWEIFAGFERKHKIEEAKLSLEQVENKLKDAKEKTDLQLRRNKITYQSMLEQIEIANQRERIAENNNKIAQKQYTEGLISITERLSSESDIYKEALNKIETIINQRKAAMETYQSAGTLHQFIQIKN